MTRAEKLSQAAERRKRVALAKVRARRAQGERVGWGVLEVDPKYVQVAGASDRAKRTEERRRYAARTRNPRRRDDVIDIRWYATPNTFAPAGGWLPVFDKNGQQYGDTYSHRGFDKARALELAEAAARDQADRYSGDWKISVKPKAPARGRRARNPRKATMATRRRRNRFGHFLKTAARKLRRARDKFGHFLPLKRKRRKKRSAARRTKRNPSTGGTMSRALVANPRKRRRRRAASLAPIRRRRRRRITSNPRRRHRRHYRRNPSGLVQAAMGSILPMGLGGIGGAISGFADAKFMSDMPVVSALSKIIAGAAGAAVLRRRPALAFGWAGGVMGSFGYSLGVKAAGGLVAHSASGALKGIADMASENPEMAALLEGLGDLQPDQVGDVGDQVGDAGDDYSNALGDSEESQIADLIDAQ